MASNYGRNFGFRRSDETMAIREGRQKVPANPAGGFRQGMGVCIDEANSGFLRLMNVGEAAVTGYSGLLVQEEAWDTSTYEAPVGDSFGLSAVKNSRLATIWSGNGTKVWFKNTPAQQRVDGRAIPAANPVDFAAGGGVVVGAYLGITAPGVWGVVGPGSSPAPATAQMRVTLTDGTSYLEAVLIK